MKRKNERFRDKLNRLFEMPVEISKIDPKITICNFENMLIENYKSILEYEDFFIRINTKIGIININGFNLKLEEMTSNELMIKGKIEGIDFEPLINEEE